jgi:hypothetical protein
LAASHVTARPPSIAVQVIVVAKPSPLTDFVKIAFLRAI